MSNNAHTWNMTRRTCSVLSLLLFFLLSSSAWSGGLLQSSGSLKALQKSEGNITYFVDAIQGDDSFSGTTPEKAWRTLSRVNVVEFAPGDSILFKAGGDYCGQLKPSGSGKKGSPIGIGSYGEGDRPHIKGEGNVDIVVLLYNVEYWEVTSLEVSNKGTERKGGLIGVAAHLWNFGTAHHILLKDLYVHDIYSTNKKGEGGCGIEWQSGRWTETEATVSRYDGLIIEDCHLVRCDRDGIRGRGCKRDNWFPHLNVRVRKNVLEDIGGDGIVPISCDRAVVEHNRLKGAHMRCKDAACGIWPWNCDDSLIQYNEVSGMQPGADGEAFDSDWSCNRSIFQFNYSHDNPGGFMNVCNAPKAGAFNKGTIIRYNISENDGTRIFKFAGDVESTHIYNNVIYIPRGTEVQLIHHWHWGGRKPKEVIWRNNIFFAAGTALYDWQGAEDRHHFKNNVFHGNHIKPPGDPFVITVNPGFVNPGQGGEGFKSLSGYRLRPDSPLLKRAMLIENNGGSDFWDNPIAEGAKSFPGVHQFSEDAGSD